jgi:hypothetical protein
MHTSGLSLNEHTYSSVVSAIADSGNLQEGQQIHALLMVMQMHKESKYSYFTGEVWGSCSLFHYHKLSHLHVFKV